MAHPKVARGRGDRRAATRSGRERPLACVVVEAGRGRSPRTRCSSSSRPKVAKWQLPDDVVFIDEVPKTRVGKFSKKTLRERFADIVLP